MRILYLLSVILLLAFSASCEKEKSLKLPVEIYSEKDFHSKIKFVDTFCINETARAENDIRNGELVLNVMYLHSRLFHHGSGEFDRDIERILAKHGIKTDTNFLLQSCIKMPHEDYLKYDCYSKTMRDEILKKFGESYLDTLSKAIERHYVLSRPNKIYSMLSRDMPPYSDRKAPDPAYDFIQKKELEIERNFEFPKGYANSNEDFDGCIVDAEFLLMKDGTIENLAVEIEFKNKDNYIFSKYFENQIRKSVRQTKWVHPTFGGIVGNCEMSLNIYLNPSKI